MHTDMFVWVKWGDYGEMREERVVHLSASGSGGKSLGLGSVSGKCLETVLSPESARIA